MKITANTGPSLREYIARKLCLPQPEPTAAEPEYAAGGIVPEPEDRIVGDDDNVRVLEAIDTYLRTLGSSNWGRSFSIDQEEGRQRAAAYILNVLRGVFKAMPR